MAIRMTAQRVVSGGGGSGGEKSPSTSPRAGKRKSSAGRGTERFLHGVLATVLRRRGWLLAAPLLYVTAMLMLSWDLEGVPVRVGVAILRRLPPGSVYRSPQVFQKLWPYMQADVNHSNAMETAWNHKTSHRWKPCFRKKLSQAVAGKSEGISIHAVFISKVSGEELKKYVNHTDVELWIIPYFMNSPWAIWAISFVSLLALSAVLAACFFVRGRRITHIRRGASRVHVFHGMSNRSVEAMQSQLFSGVLRGDSTTKTCAICLEDYSVGEKLRILPCQHRFHANCVDSWLTRWRTFCPMCKQDAQTSHGVLPASERTPLCIPTASSSSTLPSFPDQLC